MLQEPIYPAALRTDLARPLVAAAQALAQIAPWEFMADSEVIGVRDERNGELRVGSILGSLKEVFAVIMSRGAAGIGWIHRTVTKRARLIPSRSLRGWIISR
jgi:hypothetical protein